MARVFISYRRADSRDVAERIRDRLKNAFGETNVLMDASSIPPGTDYRVWLERTVANADVVLAIIGSTWVSSGRLQKPDDLVRIEVEWALDKDVPIIPILVGGAVMPKAGDLPDSLGALVGRQGMPVRSDPDFHPDVDRLIANIETLCGETPPATPPGGRPVGPAAADGQPVQFDPAVFQAFRSHFIAGHELPAIHAINDEAFQAASLVPRPTMEAWWRANPLTIRLITTGGGESVGYWQILPLAEDVYKAVAAGTLPERRIRGADVLPYPALRRGAVYIYITAVATRAKMRPNSAAVVLDLIAFLRTIDAAIGIDGLCAQAVSNDPINAMANFGMVNVGEVAGTTIWVLDTKDRLAKALEKGMQHLGRLGGLVPLAADQEEESVRQLLRR